MPASTREQTEPSPSRVGRVLDAASDWAVLAFAVWTLLAYVGMLTGAAVTPLVWIWVGMLPLVGAALVLARRGLVPSSARAMAPGGPDRAGRLAVAGLVSGPIAAVLFGLGSRIPWALAWAPAAIAVAFAVVAGRLRSRPEAAPASPLLADLVAAGVSGGFAVMSLFLSNPNADDAFYINRATATAQLDRIPVRDVLFTNEQYPPISGAGLPVEALHALQGAVARLLDVDAGSVAYLLTPPVATFLATWALWRLVRLWAPRRALLCFLLGCQYWIWSAGFDLSAGSFFLGRIWQGKVIFVAWMVPTLYVLLTRWLSRQDALTGVMLFTAAFASLGLTGSATFVTPLVFGTAALALVARREWRPLAVVTAAACVPLAIGAAVTSEYPLSEAIAGALQGNEWTFTQVFSAGVVASIGVAGLIAAPWFARGGPAARITTGVAVIVLVVLAPGVLLEVSDLTGLTDTLRRLLWVAPLPALVALLAAVPVRRIPAIAAALIVAGLLIGFGHPVWRDFKDRSTWVSRPEWKTWQYPLDVARGILARYDGSGEILAAQPVMRAIAMETVTPKAVSPRDYYARLLPEPRRLTIQRLVLSHLATRGRVRVSHAYVQRALADLHVQLICLGPDAAHVASEFGLAARYRPAFAVGETACWRR